ncbi:GNAT superfamily N-acetyltransferase [Catenuloplanes nepalensis]|uniref:GNAT superfamily N-acetyltransferase n=1 Tax=Catenuloplanes nepalensis TaxID=587533 RepID=A0ABT9N0K5_9ACTN|nr:GNAT superfamily N-acetyltransferase [Catenuloplanes nepalensis]
MRMRRAVADDIPAIVELLADDGLGRARESVADLLPYRRAFDLVNSDPAQLLAVAEIDGVIVGTLRLTVIPGLAQRGRTRGLVEAVRIASGHRGRGLGAELMRWVIDEARSRGCSLVQLTSNASRGDAHRFYERLGFTPSHVGFKLEI